MAEADLPSSWQVFAVLGATMLGFAGSIFYSHRAASQLDEEAESIANDASPAIEHLTAARGEILRLQLAAGSALDRAREGAPLDRAPFDEALGRFHRALAAYLALPFYPYEQEHYAEVDQAARALEAEVSTVAGRLSARDVAGARAALREGLSPAAARADRAIEQLVDFNAEQQHRLGVDIPRLRARAANIGDVLATATAALGLALMWLVVRALRRSARQAAEATRARDDLLATVSHDLKNPLNTIRMAAELVRRTGEEKAGELAGRIDRAAERMIRLIADLLDASKIEAGALRLARRPEDAASLVNAAVDMFGPLAAEKSIPLSAEAPPQGLAVLCERDLVMRVFSNLIGNAIKFSPEGAPIAVVAEEQAGQAHFAVSDRGPGIPAEHLAHVFDRYWQVKGGDRRGSGLGLYIARGIVEAHGGRIWITSTAGAGTTVHFTLPLAQAPAQAGTVLS